MAEERVVRIFVEAPSGDRFEAEIPCLTRISQVAVDFFDSQGWPATDHRGASQRAVVELVNPNNSDETKRLSSDIDICGAGVNDGDTLRILPESRAAAVDQRARLIALRADYNDIEALCQQNPQITFTTKGGQPPDAYEVTLHYLSFTELLPHESQPQRADNHRIEIILGAEYPRRAPIVRCLTPVFHPNIHPLNGVVCLGALGERYLPAMGLVRLIRMLVEVVQWRNFDAFSYYNQQAADWAKDDENRSAIEDIGGYPLQGPLEQYIKQRDRTTQPRIIFRRPAPEQ